MTRSHTLTETRGRQRQRAEGHQVSERALRIPKSHQELDESWVVVVHAFNPDTQKTEDGRSPSSKPSLQSKFRDSQGYTEKLYRETPHGRKELDEAERDLPLESPGDVTVPILGHGEHECLLI